MIQTIRNTRYLITKPLTLDLAPTRPLSAAEKRAAAAIKRDAYKTQALSRNVAIRSYYSGVGGNRITHYLPKPKRGILARLAGLFK